MSDLLILIQAMGQLALVVLVFGGLIALGAFIRPKGGKS